MAEFLVELYVPSEQLPAVRGWEETASRAAADVSREGLAVRYVRSIVVPEDETCFLLYQAPSIDLVRSAVERAGIGTGRITETLTQAALPAQPAGLDSSGVKEEGGQDEATRLFPGGGGRDGGHAGTPRGGIRP